MLTQPNIVWTTLDSVRADHTSLHGYSRDTTPNLERIGDRGAIFENCFAHSVATAASSASIFTGTYPSKHRVTMGDHVGTIPEELRTAAELFGEAGFHTACVTTNPRLSLIGADAGFDTFHDISRSTLLNPSNVRTTMKFLANLRSHSTGIGTKTLHHSFSLILNDLVIRWVDDVTPDDDPFFLYLHYNEPHRPYLPPLPYRDRYTSRLGDSPSEAADIALDLHENAIQYIADGLPLSQSEWDAVTAMYDSEIAYADEMVGKLFDSIESSVEGETTFVVTADHGELLGERGLFGHLYEPIDALVHVPTVARNFPGIDGPRSEIIQHVDLMKTLLLTAEADAEQFDGVDLREDERSFAVSQEYVPNYDAYESQSDSFDATQRPLGAVDSLRTGDYRLVTHDRGTELYRLPDESTDISGSSPEVRNRLCELLTDWRAAYGQPITETASEVDYDERTEQRLADLGYLR